MERHQIAVLIPSHNELKTLKKLVLSVRKLFFVLVVDDHSTDGTFEFLKKNQINYIRNNEMIGYEKSLIKGFKYIINHLKKIKNIITMDADGEHLPKELRKFSKLKNYDLVIGKRSAPNREVERLISCLFQKKFKLYDPLSGFKMYSAEVLKKQKKFSEKYFLVDLASNIISKNKEKCANINVEVKKRDGKSRLDKIFQLYLKMAKIILLILFFAKHENKT